MNNWLNNQEIFASYKNSLTLFSRFNDFSFDKIRGIKEIKRS